MNLLKNQIWFRVRAVILQPTILALQWDYYFSVMGDPLCVVRHVAEDLANYLAPS